MSTERWLPVVGFEDRYEVSDLGRVRSIPHLVNGRWGNRQWTRGRILRAFPKRSGYVVVGLSRGSERTERTVHSLVAEAFLGPRPEGKQVCHGGDGDKSDNRVMNLRYGTPSENVLDKQTQGRDPYRSRTHCPRRHLLVAPNLKKSQADKGQRACLSCDATRVAARGDASLWQELSDQHYARLGVPNVAA